MLAAATVIWLTAVVMIGAIALRGLVVVPTDAAYVVERLGRYLATLESGVHWTIPFLDSVRFRHRTSEQDLTLESSGDTTADGIPLRIAAELRWRVVDATKASYAVSDLVAALRERALIELRKEIGKVGLGELLTERDAVAERAVAKLREPAGTWGAEVKACLFRFLEPPPAVVEALAREAERARAARSKS